MAEEIVSGVVIGDDGAVVGGRVKLAAKGVWVPLSSTIKLRTDEGHEIELVDIAKATIDPVVTKKGDWQELEREPGASLLVDKAPAPDVTVELYSGLIRGGMRIAAWGEVREHVLEDGNGGVYREGAKRRVVVMAPVMIFVGDQCVERLERLRETPAHEPLRPPPIVEKPKEPKTPWREVRALPIAVVAMIPCVLLFGFLLARGGQHAWLAMAACGGALLLPLVMDTIGLAFHEGAKKELDWGPKDGALAYVVLYVGTCGLTAWAYTQTAAVLWTSLIAVTLACVGIGIVVVTRRRRRLLRLIASASPLGTPIRDGVWGAVDGHARTVVGDASVEGWKVIAAHGKKSSGEDREYVVQWVSEIVVGDVAVRMTDASWLSIVSIVVESKLGRMSVDTIREGASVRVVGRAKDGVIAKGGEESLLVFAADIDGDAKTRVRELAKWDAVMCGLAIVGSLILIAASFGGLSLL